MTEHTSEPRAGKWTANEHHAMCRDWKPKGRRGGRYDGGTGSGPRAAALRSGKPSGTEVCAAIYSTRAADANTLRGLPLHPFQYDRGLQRVWPSPSPEANRPGSARLRLRVEGTAPSVPKRAFCVPPLSGGIPHGVCAGSCRVAVPSATKPSFGFRTGFRAQTIVDGPPRSGSFPEGIPSERERTPSDWIQNPQLWIE